MSVETTPRSPEVPGARKRGVPILLLALAPLAVLALVVLAFVSADPLSGLRGDAPPVEELTITRAKLTTDPRAIELSFTNGGPDPVKIAQVLVDDAYWTHTINADDSTFERFDRSSITIPYPWVEGEAFSVSIISSTGVKFTHDVAVAVEAPRSGARSLWTFTLIGIFVGVIPVLLGITWLPFLRRVPRHWVDFFLALTAGLLVFLLVDALDEAFETSASVPGAFQGVGLIVVGFVGSLAALYAVGGAMRQRRGESSALYVAALIALGIGLHNLGEGLAIGAAFSLGEVGLTSFLIIGFMIHNITEGLGIVSPLARSRPSLWSLIGLGLLAGVPTIVGAWSGGLAYSPIFAVLFLAIGAGAIVQVVWEITKLLRTQDRQLSAPLNAVGFATGVLVMYLTGVIVAA